MGDCCQPQQSAGWLTAYKVDTLTGLGLPGAVFQLTAPDGSSLTATTDGRGLVQFCILPCANYVLTEITPPAGYRPMGTSLLVSIDASGCVFVNGQYTQRLVLPNELASTVTGSFTATKANVATGLPLAGAEFTLTSGPQLIATALSTSTGAVAFADLAPGTYQLTETVTPPGFQPAMAVLPVIVAEDGSATIDGLPANDYQLGNTPVFLFAFNKIDEETTTGLIGATFALSLDGSVIGTATSNAAGLVNFGPLAPGTYEFTETVAPVGYFPDDTVHVGVVAANGTITVDGLPLDEFVVADVAIPVSDTPTLDPVTEGDTEATGTGVAACTITVSFSGSDQGTATVLPGGGWSATIPALAALLPGALVSAVQSCPDSLPSNPDVVAVLPEVIPPVVFSVVYDANGGTGAFSDTDLAEGTLYQVRFADEIGISQALFTLANWNTAPDGSGTAYEEDETIAITADLTLYAQWEFIG